MLDGAGNQSWIYFDDQWRITATESPSERVQYDWAPDMTSVTVTSGYETPVTVPVDVSDEALVTLAEAQGPQMGIDVDHFREFVEKNPGVLGEILRGEKQPPMLASPSLTVAPEGVRKVGGGALNPGVAVMSFLCQAAPGGDNAKGICEALFSAIGLVLAGLAVATGGTGVALLIATVALVLSVLAVIRFVMNLLFLSS